MQVRTPVALSLSALVLTLAGAGAVSAQSAAPAVGEPVPVVDTEGVVHGSVTVKEVVDPFTGFDPAAPPADGMRYITLTVTYEAAPDQSLDAQPYQIVLQGANGTIFYPQYVPRPADSKIPDLQSQLMAPDNRLSGIIGYVVPATEAIAKVAFSPSWDRLSDIADLGTTEAPALGEAVTYTDANGASVSVSAALIDPFTGFDPAYPPAEGTRFVVAEAVYEGSGELPYYADPWDIYLRDSTGLLIAPTSVYVPPGTTPVSLEGQTMNPGDRVSGYVGFAVPAEMQIADVLYTPESGRVVSLGRTGAAVSPAEASPGSDG